MTILSISSYVSRFSALKIASKCLLNRVFAGSLLFVAFLEDSSGAEKEAAEAFRPPKSTAGAGDDDDSGCRLQSRPAIRRAAAIARNRILETSL